MEPVMESNETCDGIERKLTQKGPRSLILLELDIRSKILAKLETF